MFIAERRLSGSSPLRPQLGPEYALAILWAEAALGKAGEVGQRERIERFLNRARLEHNNHWVSPSGSQNVTAGHLLSTQSQASSGTFPTRSFS